MQQVGNVCHKLHDYLTKFYFNTAQNSKEPIKRVTYVCKNAYGDVRDFEVCGFIKTQKPKYLENKTFFLHMKKYIYDNNIIKI